VTRKSDRHQRRQPRRHQLTPGYLTNYNHGHFKSSTPPTATTPTPTTPTTQQWPRRDLRRPQQLRRHDDHREQDREPATLDWHQREQPRQHQRLRPSTNSRNDSDDTTTTATTTWAGYIWPQQRHAQ
jgi:hypothetical protein